MVDLVAPRAPRAAARRPLGWHGSNAPVRAGRWASARGPQRAATRHPGRSIRADHAGWRRPWAAPARPRSRPSPRCAARGDTRRVRPIVDSASARLLALPPTARRAATPAAADAIGQARDLRRPQRRTPARSAATGTGRAGAASLRCAATARPRAQRIMAAGWTRRVRGGPDAAEPADRSPTHASPGCGPSASLRSRPPTERCARGPARDESRAAGPVLRQRAQRLPVQIWDGCVRRHRRAAAPRGPRHRARPDRWRPDPMRPNPSVGLRPMRHPALGRRHRCAAGPRPTSRRWPDRDLPDRPGPREPSQPARRTRPRAAGASTGRAAA